MVQRKKKKIRRESVELQGVLKGIKKIKNNEIGMACLWKAERGDGLRQIVLRQDNFFRLSKR